jgi:hypothetical protein
MSDDTFSSAYRLSEPPSPHLTEETWEALVDGTLAASEREAAQEHVTRCDACAKVYQGLAMFERESRALGAPVRSVSPGFAPFRYWPASIAALLVMGVAAGLLYRGSPPAPINAPMPAPATTEARAEPIEPLAVRVAESRALINRSPGGTSQAFLAEFNSAIEPYRSGRFAEAAERLAALGTRFPDAPEPPLYEGVARLLSHNPGAADAAIGPLDRASQLAKGSEWQPDAEYYGARARLAAGREEARPTLVRLCTASGPYQSQACRALGATAPASVR